MYLDFFDRKILDILSRKHESMTLGELVSDLGFARSTVIIHLERLGSEGLVLKEKKPGKGRGRLEFLYHAAHTSHSNMDSQPSVVMLEFSKIEELNPAQIGKLKELFIKNKHPRFKKEFAVSRHQPFGKTSDYVKCIENADLSKIGKLVKLVGMLLQTKVYLFWQAQNEAIAYS